MTIDWMTAIAQMVNFVVLVLLLKRFLYRPVLAAMDSREALIAGQLEAARTQQEEATREKELIEEERIRMQRERRRGLARIEEEGEHERQRLLEAARADVEAARTRWQAALDEESRVLSDELCSRVGRLVIRASRRALSDLGGIELERQIIERFIERFDDVRGSEVGGSESDRDPSGGSRAVVVRSAFEIPSALKRKVEIKLEESLGKASGVEFLVEPELIGGIEVRSRGERWSWDVGDYLDGFGELLPSSGDVAP